MFANASKPYPFLNIVGAVALVKANLNGLFLASICVRFVYVLLELKGDYSVLYRRWEPNHRMQVGGWAELAGGKNIPFRNSKVTGTLQAIICPCYKYNRGGVTCCPPNHSKIYV